MAEAQFEIINDAGTILIDDKYPNMALLAQGTGTPPAPGPGEFIAEGGGGKWFRFGPLASTSTYGLVIMAADGRVIFDALWGYARVVDILSGTALPPSPIVKTYPAGRVYAAVRLKWGRSMFWNVRYMAQNQFQYYQVYKTLGYAFSGATITINTIVFDSWEDAPRLPIGQYPQQPGVESQDWTLAILDVTGF